MTPIRPSRHLRHTRAVPRSVTTIHAARMRDIGRATFRLAPPLALVVVSLACASATGRVDSTVDVPVPSAWSVPPAASEAAAGLTDGTIQDPMRDPMREWWRAFENAELERLVEIALESNRDLRSAAARLDGAVAQARIAGAARKPEAALAPQASRTRQNFIGLPIPGAEDRVLSNTSTALGVSINVSWEADLWGRIRDGRLAALARADAAAADLEAARLSITGQTAKAWFAYLEASKQAELASTTVANRAGVRRRIEGRYQRGLRTALDLRLAIADEAGARALQAARIRQQDAVRRQLEVLLARSSEALDIIATAPSTMPALPPPPDPGTPDEVLRRRPDLQASERRLAGAGLDVAAARKLLYPRLTLTGSSGTRGQEAEDLVDSDFSVWSLAAGLLQPLFQGGRLRAGVERADATRRDVLAQHENAVIRAVTDVEARIADDSHLAEQQRAVAKANQASVAAEALARDRYFSGLSDYLSLLAAQDRATSSASQLLEIDRLRLERRVDLYLALGGVGALAAGAETATAQTPAAAVNEDIEDSK